MGLLNPYSVMSGNGAANLNSGLFNPNSNGVYANPLSDLSATNPNTASTQQGSGNTNPYTFQSQNLYAPGAYINTPNSQPATSSTPGQLTSPTSPYTNPFMSNPSVTNPNGTTTPLNPVFWGTQDLANQIAKQYGGTVVSQNPYGGNFSANQPQYWVQMANGTMVNPADIADLYNHGYGQSRIDQGFQTILNGGIGQAQITSNAPLSAQAAPFFTRNGDGSTTPKADFFSGTAPAQTQNPTPTFSQNLQSVFQNLFPQQQPQDPFAGLISQLYGGSPFNAAFGPYGQSFANSLLSNSGGGANMLNIAQLLNAIFALRQSPAGSGVLSPLFWGAQPQSQNNNSNYFPSFF